MSKTDLRKALADLLREHNPDGDINVLMKHLQPAVEFVEIALADNLKIRRGEIRQAQPKLLKMIESTPPELVAHMARRPKEDVLADLRRPFAPRYESPSHVHKLVGQYVVPVLERYGGFRTTDTAGAAILDAIKAVYKHSGILVAAGLENTTIKYRTTLAKYREHAKKITMAR